MAGTKRKFEEDALTKTGYVCSLSPIKISNNNNKYFDGVLQTDSDVYQRMACFDVSLYAEMSRANQQRSPIKVVNCREVYNRLDAKKTDVLLNYKSKIEVAKQLSFNFHDYNEENNLNVENIGNLSDVAERKNVSLQCVKVVKRNEEEEVNVRGQNLKKTDIVIGDNTGYITLTQWGDCSLEENKIYVLKNVTVRQFRDVKLLSTTKTTEISLSNNQDKLQEVTSETYEEQALLTNTSSNGNIISITIAKNYTCPSCHKNIAVNSDSQFVRCSSCNMKVLKGSLTSSMHATMSFKPTDADAPPLKLMCFDKCLKDFITAVQKPNFQTDVDELENFLLLNQFNLSYDESFVVSKISQVKQ